MALDRNALQSATDDELEKEVRKTLNSLADGRKLSGAAAAGIIGLALFGGAGIALPALAAIGGLSAVGATAYKQKKLAAAQSMASKVFRSDGFDREQAIEFIEAFS